MATIDGARALGMQETIGSLEVGKRADMIALNTHTPRMTPLITSGQYMNLQHNLVHAAQGGDVAMTMVDGQVLVRHGELLCDDLSETIRAANQSIGPLLARRDAWIASAGTAVNELEKS
jgi:5-methylthioadenosine/S-adenosylhomocysteine deaminase